MENSNIRNPTVKLSFTVTADGDTYEVAITRTWRKSVHATLQEFVDRTVVGKLEDLSATYGWPDDMEVFVSKPHVVVDEMPNRSTDGDDVPNGVVL